uniref:Uncharacterized protein n=1 Tax=Caenorhabditis japonica TaxID=281687 RepID=A0A8R1E9A4_CAEJA
MPRHKDINAYEMDRWMPPKVCHHDTQEPVDSCKEEGNKEPIHIETIIYNSYALVGQLTILGKRGFGFHVLWRLATNWQGSAGGEMNLSGG